MLITSKDMHFVSKRWGWESHIVNNDKYCGKILFVKAGQHSSFHKHLIKDEVLFCSSGLVHIVYEDGDKITFAPVKAGDAFHMLPGMKHQIVAIEDSYIVEFSTTHADADSIRTTTDLVDYEKEKS